MWVGEFGTVVGDASAEWRWLLTYVRDMHYWPLNGYSTLFETPANDTYGLFDCDWATVRDAAWTKTVFPDLHHT